MATLSPSVDAAGAGSTTVQASVMRTRLGTIKRLAASLGLASLVLLSLGSVAIWDRYFRTPAIDLLPIPHGLVAVQSPSGQRLLAQSRYIADYPGLTANFVSQSRPAYCGVASSVATLNALRSSGPRLDQSTFFTDSASKVRHPLHVSIRGMSLMQLAGFLRAHGAETQVFLATDTDIDRFRAIAKQNLATHGDFVLVNYQRAELGQSKMGHISPLAAYDTETDRFLILDVATYKYPPVWVSTRALWNAMSAPLNERSKHARGFIVVREGRRQG